MCFNEPELPDVPDVDKNIVRNVLYTAWALQVFSIHFVCLLIFQKLTLLDQENSSGPSVGWKVRKVEDGYLVSISYGEKFSIALQDLQLISDVNPLRVASVFIRGIHFFDDPSNNKNKNESTSSGGGGCVIVVKVLDQHQPITITESEVVRVKKRQRGFLSSFFY